MIVKLTVTEINQHLWCFRCLFLVIDKMLFAIERLFSYFFARVFTFTFVSLKGVMPPCIHKK